jgi:hypothetical protein
VLIPAVFMGFNIVLMIFRQTCYLQFYSMYVFKIVGSVVCVTKNGVCYRGSL